MRILHICTGSMLLVAILAAAQQSAQKANQGTPSNSVAAQPEVNGTLESNVRAEWEAFKKKDKKAYGDLLADDFVAVEDDGDGARNKIHAVNEIAASNVHNYSLAFFKVFPVGPDTVFVTYEVTMEFPPKAVNRFKRLLISEVWIKRNGQWKAWHYQETRVK
jgi:hypothetical protein